MNELKIQAVMHPFPHTIGLDQDLRTAREMLNKFGIRHLPVQNGGKLVGVLTDRDINFALAVDKKDPQDLSVEECFTSEPYIVETTELVSRVARRMSEDHLGCALVTQKEKLVGIFTTVDACRVLSEVLAN